MPSGAQRRVSRLLVGAAAVAMTVAACAGEVASSDDRKTQIYATALDWLLDRPDTEVGDVEEPLIYIEHLGSDAIALAVQVDLIDRYDDVVELRFVDARTEAVDESVSDAPVREGRVLIGLGPISEENELRAEVYRSSSEVTAYRFRLHDEDGWRLSATPTPIEPEGLVADP
ncbi:MAG: hypothetical protein AAGA99_10950 [Actinomycetota bacterium]